MKYYKLDFKATRMYNPTEDKGTGFLVFKLDEGRGVRLLRSIGTVEAALVWAQLGAKRRGKYEEETFGSCGH